MSIELLQRVCAIGTRLDVSPGAHALLLVMAFRADEDGTNRLSIAELSRQAGICRRSGISAKAQLEELGIIDGRNINIQKVQDLHQNGAEIAPKQCKNCTSVEDGAKTALPMVQDLHHDGAEIAPHKDIDIIDTLSASARACEDKPSAVATFCRAYPKRTFLNATVQAAWNDCLAEGITAEEIMRCLELAKMSKAWEEQQGRFIPKAAVWLYERRFSADLKQVRAELSLKAKRHEYARVDDDIEALVNGVDDDIE